MLSVSTSTVEHKARDGMVAAMHAGVNWCTGVMVHGLPGWVNWRNENPLVKTASLLRDSRTLDGFLGGAG
jgi:hypothetical protein